MTPDFVPVCEVCGCRGNEECGHETLGNDCSLDPCTMTCPCCLIDPNHMRNAQAKHDKQMELIS